MHGAANGSLISPIACNINMEDFEQRALAGADDFWRRSSSSLHRLL